MTFRNYSRLLVAGLAWAAFAVAADVPSPRAHPSHGNSLERIVAVVNDGVVTESELDAEVVEVTQRLRAQNVSLPSAELNRSREQLLCSQIACRSQPLRRRFADGTSSSGFWEEP